MNGKAIYEEKVKFTYSDFDAYDKILPSVLQKCFQDIAGKHAEIMGVGYLDMIAQGALWIVSKIHMVLLKNIEYDCEYTIRTWPHRKRLIYFPREYAIYDSEGNLVVKCMSTWHIFSKDTRQIMSLDSLNLGLLDSVEKIPSNFDSWNIDIDNEIENGQGEPRLEHLVTFTELDHNGHMNNTHYSDVALNSLNEIKRDDVLEEVKIIFLSECALRDVISTFYYKSGDEEYIKGVKDGKNIFITAFKFKEVR